MFCWCLFNHAIFLNPLSTRPLKHFVKKLYNHEYFKDPFIP